jgi:DNA-binding protein HU-beta
MIKKDFLKLVSNKVNLTLKDTELIYNVIFETIKNNVKKDKIFISNFGTFSVIPTKARTGRNLQTGKEIKIPASNRIKFSPSLNFKKKIK